MNVKRPLALDRFLMSHAIDATRQPLSKPVAGVSVQDYLTEMGFRRLGWRAVRREIIFLASGQAAYKQSVIKKSWARGLWLYFGEGQFGDALMDLAPRSLLREQGIRMDLLTEKHLSELFQGDPWFDTVTSDPREVNGRYYDFAVVLSNKRRALQIKRKFFKRLPWVSVLESFSGPDFHRAGYATQRFADLLKLDLTSSDFIFHSSQKLKLPAVNNEPETRDTKTSSMIAICIGGVDPRRTYKTWDAVIEILLQNGWKNFMLIGGENGIEDARRLVTKYSYAAHFFDHVGKTSITRSHELLSSASMVVCSDGGLMHLAAATGVPMVALFSSPIHPEWRLPARKSILAISSKSLDVNDISPVSIASTILLLAESTHMGA